MHVTIRDGMRTVTLTEEEFDDIHCGFLQLQWTLDGEETGEQTDVHAAERVFGEALQLLIADETETRNQEQKGN